MIATDNINPANMFDDPISKWNGNTARLIIDNHSPVVPLIPGIFDGYKTLSGWTCLGWSFAPWPSKTGLPTCIVFEHENGELLWAHCNHHISVQC